MTDTREFIPAIDIRPDHWAIVRDILHKHVPQYAVWAFGSRAKWTAKEFSDLDLAIITDSPLPLATSAALADDFSESDLPWKVDIVDWAETSETFQQIIEKDRVVVQEANYLLTKPLNKICSLIVDCPHSTPAWTDSGFIVLRNQNIKNGKLDLSLPSFTDETHFIGRNRRAKPSAGDIVITREAPMGEVCMIPDGLECCLGQRQVLLRPDPKIANSRYVLYVLQSESVQHQIGWNEGTGSTVSNLRIPVLEALQIPMRPLKEQRAIAHILGTLDDRIELNRKMNETLEAMARSLFKSWFVDFDGVSAQGMQESELKPIPKKWSWEPLSKLIEFNPIEPLRKGTISPYLDMAALPTVGSWPDPPILREYSSGMRFRNGDTLLARITPCLENGKTAFIQCLPENTLAWGSTEFIVMRPINPVPAEYAYLLARDKAFRNHAIRSMTGTSGRQRVQSESIAQFKVAYPDSPTVWQTFAESASPLFRSIKANAESTQSLTQLRDTLLPKLISGELRIKDAERLAETA